jgi:hypothetical protein
MDVPSLLPQPPHDPPKPPRRGRLVHALGVWGVLIALTVAYGGGVALMAWNVPRVIEQAEICERAEALLADTEDVPTNLPRDLAPTDLAAAFPGSVLLQPNVLLTSADIVREGIPETAAWHRELDRQGFVIGFSQHMSFRGLDLGVKTERFGSHRGAVTYTTWLALDVNCRYSNEVFTGRVPGSLGFQIRYRSGNITEQLTFVRGSNRYTVSVNGPDAPADHALVNRLAEEIAQVDPR